jgi:Protein of unknown function (DUF2934)
MSINQTVSLPEDQIRAIAYSLWLEEGQPEGRAEAHWLKALELATEIEAPAKPKRKAAAAAKAAPRKRG